MITEDASAVFQDKQRTAPHFQLFLVIFRFIHWRKPQNHPPNQIQYSTPKTFFYRTHQEDTDSYP